MTASNKYKLPSRAGTKQTYTQQVAAAMNWYKHCIKGLMGQIRFQSGMFITMHEEYACMSNGRVAQLRVIEQKKLECTQHLNELIAEIEVFSSLPITLEDEERGRLPRRRKTNPDGTVSFVPRRF